RWLKGRFLLLKILKRTKKRSRFLKKEILIVFIHLEASFFPDTGHLLLIAVIYLFRPPYCLMILAISQRFNLL
ncbi:hypothetical protein, partial [Lactobacillus crispatus]|uniref:hypothetical protein n=1 Tax=Lactobacillus crispatus TaxID=47770 RepID=UPI0030F66908